MKITILYSGGLDSRIMALYASKMFPDAEVTKLFFDIGQPYAHKERAALPPDVEIRTVDWLRAAPVGKDGSSAGDIYVPGRNMTLATLAASLTTPDAIWLGALAGETHERATDKNYEFLDRLNNVLSYVMSPFVKTCRAEFPLATASFGKFESVEWALNNGLTPEELMGTSSCLSGEGSKCGTCMVCLRRWGIFKQLGFSETYDTDLEHMLNANEAYITDMIQGKYDEFRCREVLPALLMAYHEIKGLDTVASSWAIMNYDSGIRAPYSYAPEIRDQMDWPMTRRENRTIVPCTDRPYLCFEA